MGTPHASAFLVSAKRALEGSRKLPEEGEAAVGEGAPRPAGNGGADSADAEEQERSRERRAASVDQPTLHSGGTGCGGGRRGWGENPERRGEWHLRQLPQPVLCTRRRRKSAFLPFLALVAHEPDSYSPRSSWALMGLVGHHAGYNGPFLGAFLICIRPERSDSSGLFNPSCIFPGTERKPQAANPIRIPRSALGL
jgi:hypothetical protein